MPTLRASLCALLWAAALPAAAAEALRLSVGEQRTLDARDVIRVSVADPEVCDAENVPGREIVLTARRAGRTDLILWRKDGSKETRAVHVAGGDAPGLAGQIQELLAGIPGITVRTAGERVVIDGKLLTVRDRDRVKAVADSFPQVLNLSTLDLSGHEALLAAEVAKKIGFPLVTAELAGEKLVLKGTVFREADRKAAEETALAYYPSVANLIAVQEALVEIDVKFVVLRVTEGKAQGTNLLADLAGGASARAEGAARSFVVSADVPLRIQALRSEGKATYVAEPFLTTLSGKEASFHAGGEHGYRVAGTGIADVKFKKFGLLLSILPEASSTGAIRTRIALEVSAPTQQSGSGADMAFTAFRTEAELVARAGETVVVSGLAEAIRDRFKEKTPVLGEIPVLAELFRQKSSRDETKEMVLLVTPRFPAPPQADGQGAASDRIRPDRK